MQKVVSKSEILRLVCQCMTKIGTNPKHANQLATLLYCADYRGHYSHGLNRLDMYIKDVETDVTAATGNPVILKEGPSTGLVDGQNLLGPVVGKFAMQLAIDKAKQSGVGWVVANNSNHFGIAGWYAMEASSEGLLGMAFTNASPLLVPTRAVNPALGTNPISLAAPNGQEPFVLDMATSAVALGKVEIQHRRGEPLPPGWALDAQGRGTTDAAVGMQGRLFPLGGPEETSGYKGYGLACLVEIFCGLLSDANWGQHIRKWKTHERKANLNNVAKQLDVDPMKCV
uniref:Malate dehydrogenase n=3 Tax=Macrostomum lignano TaxID=282301 RepID=A0A1I8I057_9PLAT